MKGLTFALILNCLWALVLMQRLCSEKPPSNRDPTACCQRLPYPVDSAVHSACVVNFSKNTQRQLQETKDDTPKGNCIAECIANKTKIYRGQGMMDRVTLARLFLNSVSGDMVWGNIVASTVDICVNETRMKAEEIRKASSMKATFPGEILCHPISGYVLGCMNTELFKRCPNMTESVECGALQQYAASCHIPSKFTEVK